MIQIVSNEMLYNVLYNITMILLYCAPPIMYVQKNGLPSKVRLSLAIFAYVIFIKFVSVCVLYEFTGYANFSSLQAFIWGTIAFMFCQRNGSKSIFKEIKTNLKNNLKKDKPKNYDDDSKIEPQQQSFNTLPPDAAQQEEFHNTQTQIKYKAPKPLKIAIFILSFFLLCSLTLLIGLGIHINELENSNISLREKNESLEKDCSNLETLYYNLDKDCKSLERQVDSLMDEHEFFRYGACIVPVDDDYYHTYDCVFASFDGYYILNIEYAEYLGYEPCPYCR